MRILNERENFRKERMQENKIENNEISVDEGEQAKEDLSASVLVDEKTNEDKIEKTS